MFDTDAKSLYAVSEILGLDYVIKHENHQIKTFH